MALNIVEALQKKLGLAPLYKIDPNDTRQRETKNPDNSTDLDQAALTAVLAGIYKFGRTEEGASALLKHSSGNWLQTIFHDQDDEVVLNVANHAHRSKDDVRTKLEHYAEETANYIKECQAKDASPETVKTYLATQRHAILAYLPADLNMGQVLNDETIDDRTNKMDGPMSSAMHAIGGIFSGSSDAEKDTWNDKEDRDR